MSEDQTKTSLEEFAVAAQEMAAKAAGDSVEAWKRKRDEEDEAKLTNIRAQAAYFHQRMALDKRQADMEETRRAIIEREVVAFERIAAALEARVAVPCAHVPHVLYPHICGRCGAGLSLGAYQTMGEDKP